MTAIFAIEQPGTESSFHKSHYLDTRLFDESSINFIASAFLLGSKTYIISATAALCINESENNNQHCNVIKGSDWVSKHINKIRQN